MYTITKDHKLYKEFRFVLEAKSNDTIKSIFSYFWIQEDENKKIFICTDSRRLHLAEVNTDMEIGAYEVKKSGREYLLTKIEDPGGVFPEYKKLFPSIKDCNLIPTSNFSYRVVANIIRGLKTCFINYNYIEDIINHISPEIYIHKELETLPILFIDGTCKALVMPIMG